MASNAPAPSCIASAPARLRTRSWQASSTPISASAIAVGNATRPTGASCQSTIECNSRKSMPRSTPAKICARASVASRSSSRLAV
jgi:hypothetical protein